MATKAEKSTNVAKISNSSYPEIDDIKQDIESLKANLVDLTSHIKKDGAAQTKAIKRAASDKYAEAKLYSKEQAEKVENQVREKPLESVAIAFAAGVVASFIFGRR